MQYTQQCNFKQERSLQQNLLRIGTRFTIPVALLPPPLNPIRLLLLPAISFALSLLIDDNLTNFADVRQVGAISNASMERFRTELHRIILYAVEDESTVCIIINRVIHIINIYLTPS